MLVVSDHYYKLVSGRVTQIMKNSLFKKKKLVDGASFRAEFIEYGATFSNNFV